jgi:hypothetical protein
MNSTLLIQIHGIKMIIKKYNQQIDNLYSNNPELELNNYKEDDYLPINISNNQKYIGFLYMFLLLFIKTHVKQFRIADFPLTTPLITYPLECVLLDTLIFDTKQVIDKLFDLVLIAARVKVLGAAIYALLLTNCCCRI